MNVADHVIGMKKGAGFFSQVSNTRTGNSSRE